MYTFLDTWCKGLCRARFCWTWQASGPWLKWVMCQTEWTDTWEVELVSFWRVPIDVYIQSQSVWAQIRHRQRGGGRRAAVITQDVSHKHNYLLVFVVKQNSQEKVTIIEQRKTCYTFHSASQSCDTLRGLRACLRCIKDPVQLTYYLSQ